MYVNTGCCVVSTVSPHSFIDSQSSCQRCHPSSDRLDSDLFSAGCVPLWLSDQHHFVAAPCALQSAAKSNNWILYEQLSTMVLLAHIWIKPLDSLYSLSFLRFIALVVRFLSTALFSPCILCFSHSLCPVQRQIRPRAAYGELIRHSTVSSWMYCTSKIYTEKAHWTE